MSKNRSLRFRTLAEKRMSRVFESLKSIENLANKQNYAYSPSDVSELFTALRKIGIITNDHFNHKKANKLNPFSFAEPLNKSSTKKHDKFKELAKLRTTRVIKDMSLIINLSDRTNYSYTEQEVTQLFQAYFNTVTKVEARFLTTNTTFYFHN